MPLPPGRHLELLHDALRVEAGGQRLLLDGAAEDGRLRMLEAAALYRASWEEAPPASYGRLIGMLKAAVIGGEPGPASAYAREALAGVEGSVAAAYARAIAALIEGADDDAAAAAEDLDGGSPAFARAGAAIAALARGDAAAYAGAVRAIVDDFEGRTDHLTGVAIADTALMLEELAAPRGMRSATCSPLLPPAARS